MPPGNPLKTQKLKVGASSLMDAALNFDVRKCKNLVDNGADFKEKTKEHGVSVVHFAAANKKHGVELVKYFASLGCKVDAKDSEGEEPIDYAIREEAFAVAKEILTLINPSFNLLQYCAIQSNLVAAKRVHDLYPKLANELISEGLSIIHFAAYFADRRMCKWLIDEVGVGVHSRSTETKRTVLYYVSFNKSVNLKSLFGETPILLAIKAGNVCAVEKLCQLGADLSVTYNGVNLVHQCIYLDNLDVAKLLRSFSDTLVSVKTPNVGKTALHVAAELGNDRFCEWLVEEEGVNVKDKTAKGETAADLVPWCNLHLLKYLKNSTFK
ncbi:putative ankyrin repeat protein RF_0381 [Cloeon dipterum]|uniref:putative ankyrin repeat protein RF_0381 n=1 Tax=Cloeon dipterum TaxID=197152 RepID=UPI0032205103